MEIERLIHALREGTHLRTAKLDDETLALVPEGYELKHLDRHSDRLRRVDQHITAYRVPSFLSYWARFSTDDSVCFADLKAKRLTAIIDYHTAENDPKHGEHVVRYSPREDYRWSAWKDASRSRMDQKAFQRLLEDRKSEIVEPAGADLLELIANLEVTQTSTISNSERLADGSRKFAFEKNNEAKGAVTIPQTLRILTVIYEAGTTQEAELLLRWDIDDDAKKPRFQLEIPDLVGVEQAAFEALAAPVAEEIGDRFFWASPRDAG